MSAVVHVLAVMSDDARFIEELGESADDLRAARAAVAELIEAADNLQRTYCLMDEDPDFTRLRAALARCGGAA